VSPIITFSNIDEAIHISNGTAFGLSSGICTNRVDDVMRLLIAARNIRPSPARKPLLYLAEANLNQMHRMNWRFWMYPD
jgi:hypothetical protein